MRLSFDTPFFFFFVFFSVFCSSWCALCQGKNDVRKGRPNGQDSLNWALQTCLPWPNTSIRPSQPFTVIVITRHVNTFAKLGLQLIVWVRQFASENLQIRDDKSLRARLWRWDFPPHVVFKWDSCCTDELSWSRQLPVLCWIHRSKSSTDTLFIIHS